MNTTITTITKITILIIKKNTTNYSLVPIKKEIYINENTFKKKRLQGRNTLIKLKHKKSKKNVN